MPVLVIEIGGEMDDLQFLKTKAVSEVEEYVEDVKEEGRLDGEVTVSWDYKDD
jgi:hypothetical protein